MITTFFKPKRRIARKDDDTNDNVDDVDDDSGNQNKKHKSTTITTITTGSPSTSTSTSKCITPTPNINNKLPVSVAKLIHHLSHHNNGDDNCSWRKALETHFSSPMFARLATFVESERYVLYFKVL
jgi:hypothetical protein